MLYLSLEDTQRRIKDRLYNLTDSAPDNLYFAVTSGLIGGGLEEQITDFLTEHSDYQAGHHRHAAKGAGLQRQRRKGRNVRQRLR
ncbi:MAG: hypothetical protein ACLRR6_07770 [Oscillospiraceae bacterium]